jgi:hypothetical protein
MTDWFIGASTGNDANAGTTAATALRTHAELEERFNAGGKLLTPPVGPSDSGSGPDAVTRTPLHCHESTSETSSTWLRPPDSADRLCEASTLRAASVKMGRGKVKSCNVLSLHASPLSSLA